MGPSTESEKILGPEAVEMLWKTASESLRAERLALAVRLGLVRPVTDSATSFVFSGCSSLVPHKASPVSNAYGWRFTNATALIHGKM